MEDQFLRRTSQPWPYGIATFEVLWRGPAEARNTEKTKTILGGKTGKLEGLKLGERFLCTERLKVHDQVESWLAEDLDSGDKVFVKLAHPQQVDLSSRLKLAHEVQVLYELRSSSLAKLLCFGESDQLVYLVTEYVPGDNLEQLLMLGQLEITDTVSIAVRLLEALDEIHQRDILHRDIKPSNIKVASPERATLVDFGLSRTKSSQSREASGVVGSLLYMAPEQLGLLPREISAATDLYSLGVVLYECLAGRPPFLSETLAELLRKHLTQAPPPLSQFRPDIPERLEQFLKRLLSKEPQERFVTARNALLELQTLRDRIEGDQDVSIPPSRQGFRQVHAPFVGREEQRKHLDRVLEKAIQGHSCCVGISGVAGSGKTRLLDDLSVLGVKKGFTVYRGRAEAARSRGPFCLLEGIVDTFAAEIAQDTEILNRIRDSLGEQAPILAATFPSLRSLSGSLQEGEPTPWLDAKILRALRSLFQQISSAENPVLIVMDDLHWADAATRKFVNYWNSERDQIGDLRSVFVVGLRPCEESSKILSSCSLKIELPPFTIDEIEQLFRSLGTPIGVSELKVVKKLTAGNPLLVVEALRELLSAPSDTQLDLSQRLAVLCKEGLFTNRVGRVSESTQRFVQLAAQLGQSFHPLALGHATDLRSAHVFECLSEAKAQSIVWEDATSGKYYFLHDHMREHLAESLGSDQKRELHLRYAEYLNKVTPDSHYELAYHYHLAEVQQRASDHAARAARQARRRNALDTATFYFRIALADPAYAEDWVLKEELADCCMLTGEYPSALELYQQTYKRASEELIQARLLGKLGELHQKMGKVGEASQAISKAIRLLGGQMPSSTVGRRLETARRVANELLKPSETKRRGSESHDPRSRLLAHLYSRLSYVWFWTHGQADLLFIHLRHLQEAARHPRSPELAQAYASHAIACIGVHQFKRAHRFAHLSLDLRRELQDVWGEAHAQNTLGVVLYAASRIDECIEVLQRAETMLDAAGDLWELAVCRYNLALCYYRKGQLSLARKPAKRAYSVGLECGDVQASGVSLGVLVRCSPLEVSEEQLNRELSAPGLDAATKAWLLEAKGIRWLALGRANRAVKDLEESWSISKKLGRKTEYVASSPCWLATAYRKHLESLPAYAVTERVEHLKKLSTAVGTAIRWAKNFRNNLAHALREEAYFLALSGKRNKSLSSLSKSLEIAEELGLLQEIALTSKAQLRLKDVLNLSQEEVGRFSKPLLDYGELLDFGASHSISQSQRFLQVLAAATKLTKADSSQAIFQVMAESASALFHTEDCIVLERLWDGQLSMAGAEEGEVQDCGKIMSQTLARQALETGVPVTSVDELPLTESLIAAKIRSALYIPFGSLASQRCCVQITYRLVGQVFAEEELRVASYLSSLGTAALEGVASREAVWEAEELEKQGRKQLELLEARRAGLLQSLAIASHDLKNLIFVMRSVSRGLSDAKSPADMKQAQEFLELICRKANWMVSIYLNITQVQKTGSIPCQDSVFDLAELGEDVSSFLNKSLTLEGRHPKIEFQGESVMVCGDQDRLWQAVANIVGNAVVHTPQNSLVKVVVQGGKESATLSVSDQGSGISEELRDSIFDPFVQATKGSKGSGLGLWIAKLIVESSHGNLELESEMGKGSIFRITLKRGPT